jgi:SAM-dependent methyltransferase
VSASLVYRSAGVYELVMLGLYGRHYPARQRAVADLVPPGASVLDLCCGPGTLFDRHLRRKGVVYTGLDVNPRFVARVVRHGGRGLVRDLHPGGPLPEADYVIMQASLYHFLPDPLPLLARMREAARWCVVVAEPVRNLADGRVPVLAALARRHTDAGRGPRPLRFSEARLDALIAASAMPVLRSFFIPGGREKVYVLDARRGPDGGDS